MDAGREGDHAPTAAKRVYACHDHEHNHNTHTRTHNGTTQHDTHLRSPCARPLQTSWRTRRPPCWDLSISSSPMPTTRGPPWYAGCSSSTHTHTRLADHARAHRTSRRVSRTGRSPTSARRLAGSRPSAASARRSRRACDDPSSTRSTGTRPALSSPSLQPALPCSDLSVLDRAQIDRLIDLINDHDPSALILPLFCCVLPLLLC